jgi:hypothetical protein
MFLETNKIRDVSKFTCRMEANNTQTYSSSSGLIVGVSTCVIVLLCDEFPSKETLEATSRNECSPLPLACATAKTNSRNNVMSPIQPSLKRLKAAGMQGNLGNLRRLSSRRTPSGRHPDKPKLETSSRCAVSLLREIKAALIANGSVIQHEVPSVYIVSSADCAGASFKQESEGYEGS